jgi:hypothetical protein
MSPTPLFILGIAQRSGTNYLKQLLMLHPECVRSRHSGEDFIVQALPHLERFVYATSSHWDPSWGNNPQDLKKALGQAITSYLTPEACSARYVVTKTPSCKHAQMCLSMFDDAYVIIIVRRGQDLVESFVRSFTSSFSYAARLWANGARDALRVTSDHSLMSSQRVLVVTYEDLYQHNAATMKSIFDFLHLSDSHFDYEKSLDCHVVGSSSYRHDAQKLSWTPRPKSHDFRPLERSSEWNRWKHYRFNWIAGDLSRKLGYPLRYETKSFSFRSYNLLCSTLEAPQRCFRILRNCLRRQ